MAAHVHTGLSQIKEDILKNELGFDALNWDHLKTALNLSCWTEDLDFDHWKMMSTLVDAKNREGLKTWVNDMLPRYKEIWETYDKPKTREEWCANQRFIIRKLGNHRWTEWWERTLFPKPEETSNEI
ncbi:MAG: hypothetical protein ACW987_15545 [Candidatus Thorarchaeota archaeon]|jgi:hypothetical protein